MARAGPGLLPAKVLTMRSKGRCTSVWNGMLAEFKAAYDWGYITMQ